MSEEKEIEIKTEEVNELLTAVPKWIVRWGISIIFLMMVLALSLSFFIKYPDTLSAATIITTVNPPVTLISKTDGKITELKIKNNQSVKRGDVLLVIENSANYKSVQILDSILNNFNKNDFVDFNTFNILSSSQTGGEGSGLGDLTPAFIAFLKSYNDYKLQLEVNPQEKEILIINKELTEYQTLQGKYRNQENNFKEEFSLSEKDFNRYNSLFQSAAISAKELEDKKREYLSVKRNYENVKINGINNKITISNLEKNKLQLQMQSYQENEKITQALNQSIQTLKSQIESWKQTYLLKAPIDGKVSLFNYWSINQNLKQGDEVLSIVPAKKQEMIAKLFLPVANSGKLKPGQTVNIKLNNYLYYEYGMLKGSVKNISVMPKNKNYAIEVSLPNKLNTTYNKQLDYKEEMQGTADIITEELSVFERVFYQFRKILKK
ncbi:MAG: HlyD family efflux transporter periplasmic adaptor subunit [Bacteroidetes bacterium]|nr:HlyD family efflux transporter periplasmic adaptor subunit [Bacteroidota bacterium]